MSKKYTITETGKGKFTVTIPAELVKKGVPIKVGDIIKEHMQEQRRKKWEAMSLEEKKWLRGLREACKKDPALLARVKTYNGVKH